MVTRGEGGGNAVGSEIGPALGLRRENEDRIAHYRSGTVDIFNLDRVDFFYNTSAPLTQNFWDKDETLRRITRIIRMTQPEIYIGFTPSLNAGHGNHQQAGRYIWEGVKAAADPTMFPEQLTGPERAAHVAGQEGLLRRVDRRHRRHHAPRPTAPPASSPPRPTSSTVAGVWTGYDSPYKWPAGNLQGQPRGPAKSWAQVAQEGARAYPTQSRVDVPGLRRRGCSRFGMTDSFVPFQPNVNADGTAEPARRPGRRDPLRRDRCADPGGLPLGTLEHLDALELLQRPRRAVRRDRAPAVGQGHARRRHVALTCRPAGRPTRREAGRRASAPRETHGRRSRSRRPPARPSNTNYRISALYTHRRGDGLHGQRRARRPARRGPLRALGQVGGVRQLAHGHRAARAAHRPLVGRAVDRRWARRSPCPSSSTTGRPPRRPVTSS